MEHFNVSPVKLVKKQINGSDRVVLKQNASLDDLRSEAVRMHTLLGYQVEAHGTRFLVSHRFYRGKFELVLEKD